MQHCAHCHDCSQVTRSTSSTVVTPASSYHRLDVEIKKNPKYGRGRPAEDKLR